MSFSGIFFIWLVERERQKAEMEVAICYYFYRWERLDSWFVARENSPVGYIRTQAPAFVILERSEGSKTQKEYLNGIR